MDALPPFTSRYVRITRNYSSQIRSPSVTAEPRRLEMLKRNMEVDGMQFLVPLPAIILIFPRNVDSEIETGTGTRGDSGLAHTCETRPFGRFNFYH